MKEDSKVEFIPGERLDKTLALIYPQYSRSALEKLILDGYVTVNGQPKRSSYKLKQTDDLSVDLSLFTKPIQKIDLPIIYEDEDVVVIDKPAGVLTHAKGTLHNEPTVATWLSSRITRFNLVTGLNLVNNRMGIVHRLDRATSGVMICAKTHEAQTHLQKQFADRKVKKTYVALVDGKFYQPSGLIDVPIERNPKKPATFRPGINGRSAQTQYKVTKNIDNLSQVELNPYTGRTHQLRVHLSYMKHPIIGDTLYGGRAGSRLYLHAKSLEITLPNKKRLTFSAKIPSSFKKPV